LLALFAPREPLPFETPLTGHRPKPPVTGLTSYLSKVKWEDPKVTPPPPPPKIQTKSQRRVEKRTKRMADHAETLASVVSSWNPAADSKAAGDAYKTLFVGRLDFKVDEAALKHEFEHFGPIRNLRLVRDLSGKSRGYAFIEFEREKDMKLAFKEGDSRRLGPRGGRPLIDVERGRTVKDWRPRRLGGGIGSGRPDKLPKGGRAGPSIGQPPMPHSAGIKRPRDEEQEKELERERMEKRRRDDERERERGRDRPRDDHHRRDSGPDRGREERGRDDRGREDRDRGRDGRDRKEDHHRR